MDMGFSLLFFLHNIKFNFGQVVMNQLQQMKVSVLLKEISNFESFWIVTLTIIKEHIWKLDLRIIT